MTRTEFVLQRLRDPETRKTTRKPVMVVRKKKLKDEPTEAEKVFGHHGLPELR